MDIEVMREFVTLVRFANFSDAARQLNVAQPTLSKHISSLERQLKCTLIERDSRNFSLTPQGQIFYEMSMEIANVYTAGINRLKNERRREFVTVSGVTGAPSVSRFLAKALQYDDRLCIRIAEERKYPARIALEDNRVDVVFGPMARELMPIMKELEFTPLASDQAVAVVAQSSPLWPLEHLRFNDLESFTFIRVSDGFVSEPGWETIEEMCRQAFYSPRTRFFFPGAPLCLAPEEVLILPESEAESTVQLYGNQKLRSIPLIDEFARITTYLIAKSDGRSQGARRLIQAAEAFLQETTPDKNNGPR